MTEKMTKQQRYAAAEAAAKAEREAYDAWYRADLEHKRQLAVEPITSARFAAFESRDKLSIGIMETRYQAQVEANLVRQKLEQIIQSCESAIRDIDYRGYRAVQHSCGILQGAGPELELRVGKVGALVDTLDRFGADTLPGKPA